MLKKVYLLDCSGQNSDEGFNLGDDIQSLAMGKLIGRFDGYVQREHLNDVEQECVVPMNGFFFRVLIGLHLTIFILFLCHSTYAKSLKI